MHKYFVISLPAQFDYLRAIHFLQRGMDDPINRIHQDQLTRLYLINQQPVLLHTQLSKNKKALQVQLLQGQATPEEVHLAVRHVLDLDDSLLPEDDFAALLEIILGQGVSIAVANRMRRSLIKAFGQYVHHASQIYYAFPQPAIIATQSVRQLSALGISEAKCYSILLLAKDLQDNHLSKNCSPSLDFNTWWTSRQNSPCHEAVNPFSSILETYTSLTYPTLNI